MPPFLHRHLLAATASFVMVTGWVVTLGLSGMLPDLLPPDQAWERAFLASTLATFGLFFPIAAMAEWIGRRRRIPVWVPPIALALLATVAGLTVEVIAGNFHPTFILPYLTVGLVVGMVFCGYWIPLYMVTRASANSKRGEKSRRLRR